MKGKDGAIRWLHSVDAREQLERGDCELANRQEAPHTEVGKPKVDWRGVSVGKLREYAQEAGVAFTAKTREQIEEELNAVGFVPDRETPA